MNRLHPILPRVAFWLGLLVAYYFVMSAAVANAQAPTLGSALNYCRAAFVELNETGSTEKTKAAIARLPEVEQDAIAVVCTAYSAGQKDLLRLLQSPAKKPAAI